MESALDRLENAVRTALSRNVERVLQTVVGGIQEACQINLTADNEGFELASVAISLGAVTATFTPSAQFCADVSGD